MENSSNSRKDYIISLDVGTSKVSMLIGSEDKFGKLVVENLASVKSNGVNKGVISNIDKTINDIKKCYDLVTKNIEHNVSKIHIGFSGKHIDAIKHNDVLLRENNLDVITNDDINELVSKVYKYILPPGHQIVHILSQDYTIDGITNITDPVGMVGNKIEGEFHIITRKEFDCTHAKRCVEGAGLNMGSMVLTSIASSIAVLREEEKQYGVCVIDIGEGSTDIVIYKDNVVRYVDVLPFGGDIINKDIYENLNLIPSMADHLKTTYGCALASEIKKSKMLQFDGKNSRNKREVLEVNLARIIQARMTEILDFALTKIEKQGYLDNLVNGIVLTGGGALLKDVDKLAELRSGLPVRIGLPIFQLAPGGYSSRLSNPKYAGVIGLAVNALHNNYNMAPAKEEIINDTLDIDELIEEKSENPLVQKSSKIFKNLYKGVIDFFTEVEDTDFDEKNV